MEFTEIMLGGLTWKLFFVYWGYALMGFGINLIVDVLHRKPESPNSFYKFDLAYWWVDNWRRLIISFILLPFAVVFGECITGSIMNVYIAFMLGYGSDTLLVILKKKNVIKGCKL